MDALTRTWLLLLALTAATTLLAPVAGVAATAVLLALAWLKARAILGGFLHLAGAPGWMPVALVPLALWLAALLGLYAL